MKLPFLLKNATFWVKNSPILQNWTYAKEISHSKMTLFWGFWGFGRDIKNSKMV
jgi:uncharacterized membrane protein YbaN (DUF454 family)